MNFNQKLRFTNVLKNSEFANKNIQKHLVREYVLETPILDPPKMYNEFEKFKDDSRMIE